jgi:DNA-binding beta-propeller fold protein YncE
MAAGRRCYRARPMRALLVVVVSTMACAHAAAPGRVSLYAGGGAGADGVPAVQARLERPFAIARDPATGDHYIAEFTGNKVRRVDAGGTITTVVGPGASGEVGSAGLNEPHHLVFPPAGGDLYIGDTFNKRLLRVDLRTGSFKILAPEAGFHLTFNIAFDRRGQRLYVTDDKRVRAVEIATGAVTVLAGNGTQGVPADGAVATEAPLFDPRAVDVDSHGNVYILERNGHALRVVDPSGHIRTVAGTGQKGATGDGGDARQATFNGPKHVTVDGHDDVLIADTENHLIRKFVVSTGKLERVAGTGRGAADGALPGAVGQVSLNRPHGIFVDPDGVIYIADSWNDRVLKVD